MQKLTNFRADTAFISIDVALIASSLAEMGEIWKIKSKASFPQLVKIRFFVSVFLFLFFLSATARALMQFQKPIRQWMVEINLKNRKPLKFAAIFCNSD